VHSCAARCNKLLWDETFEASRRALSPEARAKGVYSDEDVFKMIS
jgi:hypothetical protein